MPRKSRSAPAQRPPSRRKRPPLPLVVTDQDPLRQEASGACRKELGRLEKARADWHRFEERDVPAFERWKAATFGALLTRIRELDSAAAEKRSIIMAVESEMMFGTARSERAAYERVMHMRAHPSEVEDDDPFGGGRAEGPGDSTGPDDDPLDDFELEMMFEDTLRMFTDIDPDRMDDASYARMFESFKASMQGRSGRGPDSFSGTHRVPEPERASRVKEIYRMLVRRLHPDVRADGNAAVSALWHEVQEAYAAGNVERLEMLLAFTDVADETTGHHTSLFQMREVLREIRRGLRALQKSLRRARKDLAWNFAACRDRSAVQRRLERELERVQASQERDLEEMDLLIESWKMGRRRSRRAEPVCPF